MQNPQLVIMCAKVNVPKYLSLLFSVNINIIIIILEILEETIIHTSEVNYSRHTLLIPLS